MKNLQQRKLDIMSKAEYAQKDTTVSTGGGSYKAVSHNAIKAILRAPMIECGVTTHSDIKKCKTETVEVLRGRGDSQYKANERVTKVLVEISLINIDDVKDREVSVFHGIGIDSGDKSVSKAITNAEKNFLINTFQLPVGENDETPYEGALSVAGQVDGVDTEVQADLEKQLIDAGMDVKKWKTFMQAGGMMVDGVIPESKWEEARKSTLASIKKRTAAKEPATKREAKVDAAASA